MLRAIGILTICRDDFGPNGHMGCRHGVGKLAQNEPTQNEQHHGQAMEDEFPHISRVRVATIPRNEWLPCSMGTPGGTCVHPSMVGTALTPTLNPSGPT
jgi:hypothetical protein